MSEQDPIAELPPLPSGYGKYSRDEMLAYAVAALEAHARKMVEGEPVAWQMRYRKQCGRDDFEWSDWEQVSHEKYEKLQGVLQSQQFRKLYTTPQPAPAVQPDELTIAYMSGHARGVEDAAKVQSDHRELLRLCLERIERDWYQIDSEWGPVQGGLDGDIARGGETLIPKLLQALGITSAPAQSAKGE